MVTGAASGIGRATAILFAKNGCRVLCSDVEEKGLAETARMANEAAGECGGMAVPMVVDVSSEKEVEAMVDRCCRELGNIDIMIANAGVSGGMVSFLDLSEEDWEFVTKINVFGVAYCAKHAAKKMLASKTKGSIVLTASVAGIRSGAGATHYSATKAAVINMAETIAWQLSGTGIRCNAVCPGLFETGMTKPLFDQAKARGAISKVGQLNPLRRYGNPQELAQAMLFLASDRSSYVNAQRFVVDGGLSGSHPVVYTFFLFFFLVLFFFPFFFLTYNSCLNEGPGNLHNHASEVIYKKKRKE